MNSNTLMKGALAIASGIALALAFPKFDLNLLAWVAFVPLFYAVADEPLPRVFLYAWLQGLACYVVSLYWVVITLHDFADLPYVLAAGPLVLLAAVLAVYVAVAIWAGGFTARRTGLSLAVTMPIAWVAVEWIRSFFPIGFPWDLLGDTAHRNLEIIQFAEFTGTYGVSALIMLFNVVLYEVFAARATRKAQFVSLGALTGLMVAAVGFGTVRIRELDHAAPDGELKVAMVQGDIPQTIKWNPEYLESSFKVYLDESESVARSNPDLIVWPEAAAEFFFQPDETYPAMFAGDAAYRERLLDLARRTGDDFLFGAPALGYEDGHLGSYNRAYLVSGDGRVVSYYDKIQLVPFGEYVPARELFGYFVNRIVKGFGDMIAGREQTLFNVKGAKLGTLICYESVFPDLTRREVKRGANILVNITNDAWYGTSSAPYQLLAMASMRAVENKVPMIRVANTGISAIITPTGKILASTPLFVRTTEVETVKWRKDSGTVYSAVGDLFAQLCFVLTAAALMYGWVFPRRQSPLAEIASEILGRNGHGTRRAASGER
jgi:apolipoprotein N-acyltransferase